MEVRPTVEFRTSSSRVLNVKVVKSFPEHPGVWEVTVDLASELGAFLPAGMDTIIQHRL